MKKNVAGQKIGAQMVSATDGSAVTTGTTTVFVTGDAGTQATGTVGAGACTHEGNGYWTYAPAQAETNFDLVAFTFINATAVPATVQVSTNSPVASNITQGQPLAGFTFLMTDATTHNPVTGKTVSVSRSINGGAFAATTNAPTEVSAGIYTIDLSAADLNGKDITFRASATGCDDTFFSIITVPA